MAFSALTPRQGSGIFLTKENAVAAPNPFDPDLVTQNASLLYASVPTGGGGAPAGAGERVTALPQYIPLLAGVTIRVPALEASKRKLDDVLRTVRQSGWYTSTAVEGELTSHEWATLYGRWVEGFVDVVRANLDGPLPGVYVDMPSHPTWRSFTLAVYDAEGGGGGRRSILTFPSQAKSLHRALKQLGVVEDAPTAVGPNYVVKGEGPEAAHAVLTALLNLAYLPYEHGKNLSGYLPRVVSRRPFGNAIYKSMWVPMPTLRDGVCHVVFPHDAMPSAILWDALHELAAKGFVGVNVALGVYRATHTFSDRGAIRQIFTIAGGGELGVVYA